MIYNLNDNIITIRLEFYLVTLWTKQTFIDLWVLFFFFVSQATKRWLIGRQPVDARKPPHPIAQRGNRSSGEYRVDLRFRLLYSGPPTLFHNHKPV